MQLNETQSGAICQAYCAMITIADTAYSSGQTPNIYLTEEGNMEVCVGVLSRTLRHVKDRSPKEIEDFVKATLEEMNAVCPRSE